MLRATTGSLAPLRDIVLPVGAQEPGCHLAKGGSKIPPGTPAAVVHAAGQMKVLKIPGRGGRKKRTPLPRTPVWQSTVISQTGCESEMDSAAPLGCAPRAKGQNFVSVAS